MPYRSSESPDFQNTVEHWLAAQGEVGVLIRFSHWGGVKEFEFFANISALRGRLRELPPRTCLTAFRERQLPLRGIVDDAFIAKALSLFSESGEYLVAGLDWIVMGKGRWRLYRAGDTKAELQEDLADCIGERVAVGPYPPWLVDNDVVISAVIPNADGTVETGVY